MNKHTSQVLNIFVLSFLVIFMLVLILKKNEPFSISNLPYRKYGLQDPNRKYDISQLDYAVLLSKARLDSYRFPGTGTLSWESDSVLRNKNLMPIMNLFYGRSCPPPLISQMGGYAIYNSQNEMLPVEERPETL